MWHLKESGVTQISSASSVLLSLKISILFCCVDLHEIANSLLHGVMLTSNFALSESSTITLLCSRQILLTLCIYHMLQAYTMTPIQPSQVIAEISSDSEA